MAMLAPGGEQVWRDARDMGRGSVVQRPNPSRTQGRRLELIDRVSLATERTPHRRTDAGRALNRSRPPPHSRGVGKPPH
jgi:hypothetical protein